MHHPKNSAEHQLPTFEILASFALGPSCARVAVWLVASPQQWPLDSFMASWTLVIGKTHCQNSKEEHCWTAKSWIHIPATGTNVLDGACSPWNEIGRWPWRTKNIRVRFGAEGCKKGCGWVILACFCTGRVGRVQKLFFWEQNPWRCWILKMNIKHCKYRWIMNLMGLKPW